MCLSLEPGSPTGKRKPVDCTTVSPSSSTSSNASHPASPPQASAQYARTIGYLCGSYSVVISCWLTFSTALRAIATLRLMPCFATCGADVDVARVCHIPILVGVYAACFSLLRKAANRSTALRKESWSAGGTTDLTRYLRRMSMSC